MYAIIKNGSHQYRINAGQFIKIDKLDLEPGQVWKCEKVLVFQDAEGQLITGTPYIEKAVVNGQVIRHGRGKKILVFKKKRRKGYRRTQGHRQEFTEIYIESLITSSGKIEKKLVSHNVKKAEAKAEAKTTVKTEIIKKETVKKGATKTATSKTVVTKNNKET